MARFHYFDPGIVAELVEKVFAVFPSQAEGAHISQTNMGDHIANLLQVPWPDIAFPSTEYTLRRYLEDREAGREPYHFTEFDRRITRE